VDAASPRVSVIVRTKDRPGLLAEALESLRRQTMDDFETLVVNDGGTPPDAATLSPAPGRGLRVLETQPPRGRTRALNTGLRAAKGTLIAYLDDDDLYLQDHLETLSASLLASDTCQAAYTMVEQIEHERLLDGSFRDGARRIVYGRPFDAARLLSINDIPLIALMHLRSTALAAGGFDESFDLFEDWDFLIRLSALTPFHYIPRVTAVYRVRPDGSNVTALHPWGGERSQSARKHLFEKYWARRSASTEIALLDGLEADRHEVEVAAIGTAESARAAGERAAQAERAQAESEGRAAETGRLLQESEGRLAETGRLLQESEGRLAETGRLLQESEGRLAETGRRLAAVEERLAGTEQRLEATEEALRSAQARLRSEAATAASDRAAAASREAALKARRDHAEGLLDAVNRSLVWRAMKPYWRLKELLRR
jgi:glycosyltransferase involved in cell wall biosynthesis